MNKSSYPRNIFINCPFDSTYDPFLNALVFTIFVCGYLPRCAKEIGDGGKIRINEIKKIIAECQFGIHDISFAHADPKTKLARFNMPLELGLFLGAQNYGARKQRKKICLILDIKKYRYQKFISDISGQDVEAYGKNINKLISSTRNWLQKHSTKKLLPPKNIRSDYKKFLHDTPRLYSEIYDSKKVHKKIISKPEMTYEEFATVAAEWLKDYLL